MKTSLSSQSELTESSKITSEKPDKLPTITHPEQDIPKLKKKRVSIAAILDRVRKRIDGSFSVRIMVIFSRYPKYYTTKMNMSQEEWLKIVEGKRLNKDLKSKEIIIHEFLRKAVDIAYNIEPFSFEAFEKEFLSQKKDKTDVFCYYSDYLEEMKKDGRLGNAATYLGSLNSLKIYTGQSKLLFSEITPSFLDRYEKWMLSKQKSVTTVGIYLRPLRHLYRKAIQDKNAKQENYPFSVYNSDSRYKIPASKNIKKALTKNNVKRIYEYPVFEGSSEHFYRDIWFFSYLCNGINMKDICLLKYQNIEGDHIYFQRAKTAKTKKDGKLIDIIITDKVKEIIETWGVKPITPNSYIFRFLTEGMSPEQEQAQIKQATKQCNKYIKRIAKEVGIMENVSTYSARHSFSTVLKQSGVSIAFVSDALGHANIKTTENYLGSFEDEAKIENAKNLTDW
jgi:integrase